MKILFGYNPVLHQLGVRLIDRSVALDAIFPGPTLLPPANVLPWVRDITLALIGAGLIKPAGRRLIMEYGQRAFAPLGFTWLDVPEASA